MNSDKEKVFELLVGNRLTSKDISEKLNIPDYNIKTYILRLLKEKRITKLEHKTGRYFLYTSIKEEQCDQNNGIDYKEKLAYLYKIMSDKTKLVEDLTAKDIEILTEIKELVG